MNMNDKYKTRDLIFFSLLSILFYLLSISYLPLVVFFIPSLFIVLGIKRGYIYAVLEGVIFVIALGLIRDYAEGLVMGGLFLISSLPFIYAYSKNLNTNKSLLLGTGVLVILTLVLTLIYNNMGMDIVASIEEMLIDNINKNIELIKSMDLGVEVGRIEEYMASSVKVLMTALPSIILVISTFLSLINYYFSFIVLNFMGFGTARIDKFDCFMLPRDFMKGVFVCIIGSFIFELTDFKYSLELAINLSIVFSFLFAVQGTAVIYYFLKKKIKSFGAMLIIFLFLILPLRSLLVFVGLFDQIFHFRFREIRRGE